MSQSNGHTLEMAIISLFEEQGYVYTCGDKIVKGESEVVLGEDLRSYSGAKYESVGITSLEVELMANVGGILGYL